jgi:hypothetical protein
MDPVNFGELIPVVAIMAAVAFALIAFLAYMARRFFAFREKQLEVETRLAAEKAAQYAASNMELEQRVRVLEQIVTDGGAQTAAQIEALRQQPRIASKENVR